MSTDTEANKKVVTEFINAMSAGDNDAIVGSFHRDAQVWTLGNTLLSGTRERKDIEASAPLIFDAFPEGLKFTISNLIAEGDMVAAECQSSGLHASGKQYANHYHFLFEVRDGKVYRLKEYMDTEAVTDVLCGGERP